uniref:Chromosome 18 open reading frame 63 n=1 Tax=Pavo cristatus TaxID=9049 RepID=A0A8C9ELB1_PAVCR
RSLSSGTSLFFLSPEGTNHLPAPCPISFYDHWEDIMIFLICLKWCFLIFLYQDVLSAPVIGTLNQISVVMAIPFYKSGLCEAYVERQGATLEAPQGVNPAILQTCLSYTLTARLAPRWNKAGHLLVQGISLIQIRNQRFILDINVSETQLCISVEACSVRLPPPKVEHSSIFYGCVYLTDLYLHFSSKTQEQPVSCSFINGLRSNESVLSSFISDVKAKFSHLCGFPLRMTSKALYATQELSRTPEIQSESMKLAGEMVCVVSLTQTPPRKLTLANISSSRSTENSHWMEHLIKEPKPHTFSSSSRSAEKISVEATEKLINRQIPGISELPLRKSLGVPGRSAFELSPKNVSKIIPIFKGRLMQMNGNTTNQTDGKERKNVERQSPVKRVKSSMLTVCKSSLTQVYKPATHSSSLQIITEKAYIKQDVSVFQWKTESGGQMINSDSSSNSAAGWSSSEVSRNKANSPSLLKNVRPALQKSDISPKLNTYASSTSSSRGGKNFASQNTTQVLRKQHQSKKVHLQICKLENEVTNSSLSQKQTKKSNEGPGLNIHESILNDTVCVAKNDESKASCHSKNCIAKTACLHSSSVFAHTFLCFHPGSLAFFVLSQAVNDHLRSHYPCTVRRVFAFCIST